MAALFLLPACSGPIGTALAGFAGAGAMYGGQAFLERGQEDVEAKREWRVKKREYVTEYANGMKFEAETHKRAGRFEDWRKVMTQLLAFWDTQHPETLIMEVRRRAGEPVPQRGLDTRPFLLRESADVVPEPQSPSEQIRAIARKEHSTHHLD